MNVLPDADFEDDDIIQWTIRTLVRDRCSPELEELYVRLNQTLSACHWKAHLDELDALLGELGSHNIGPEQVTVSVDEILRLSTERALNNCGVELNPDIPLEMLAEAADIILNFDPTDTPGVLVDLLDSAEDVDDAFCKIVDQLGTFDYEEWIPQLVQISDGFTKTVRKVCADAVTTDDVTSEDGSPDLLKRLSRLVKANGDSLGATLGSQNLGLGSSLESLYGVHVGRLLDKPVETQVDQLFSLAAISSESFESAQVAIGECLDDLCFEIDVRRQAEQLRPRYAEKYKSIFGEGDA